MDTRLVDVGGGHRTSRAWTSRVVTVEIPEELAVEAEASGLDLARACRDGLWFMMRKRRRDAAWADEHREQIEAWNEWLETHGLPFERFRVF